MTETIPALAMPPLPARALVMAAVRPCEVDLTSIGPIPGISVAWRRGDGIEGVQELTIAEGSETVEQLLTVLGKTSRESFVEFEIVEKDRRTNKAPTEPVTVELSGRFLRELVSAMEITLARMSVTDGRASAQRIDLDPDGVVRRSAAA